MSQTTIDRPRERNRPDAAPPVPVQAEPQRAASDAPAAMVDTPPPAKRRRSPALIIVGILVLVGVVVAGVYLFASSGYESTDDAYLEGHVIPISTQVAARVLDVLVDDNQQVSKGQTIVRLDPTDFQVALDQANASLAAMNGKLVEARAQVPAMQAQLQEAAAELKAAQTNFDNADADLKRYQSLDARAVSKQILDNALALQRADQAAVEQARAKQMLAESQIATAQAAVVAAEGDVAKARADVKQAQVNLGYCTIAAPEDGRVTRKSVEPGAYVPVGQALLAIVPDQVWVIANFKETQLTHMRPKQPVSITIDAYPGRRFTGWIDSIQSGTGSRFSALPAENATGNFVKIVQRVPVKIWLDAKELKEASVQLAPGMSVEPVVNTR